MLYFDRTAFMCRCCGTGHLASRGVGSGWRWTCGCAPLPFTTWWRSALTVTSRSVDLCATPVSCRRPEPSFSSSPSGFYRSSSVSRRSLAGTVEIPGNSVPLLRRQVTLMRNTSLHLHSVKKVSRRYSGPKFRPRS